jgi:hypothetical protein
MSTEDLILVRLNALEKQNRWMKRIGAAMIVVAASLFVMAQKPAVNRTIEANEFVLKDASGRTRAKLGLEGGPGLVLYDETGKDRAWLSLNPLLGAMLSLYSGNGKSGPLRDGLVVDLNQMGLALFDDGGYETRIGSTDLVTPRTGETHQTSAASVILFGKDKKILFKAP